MHEIAESPTGALPHFILTTTRLPEVGDRRQLPINGLPIEPPIVDIIYSFLCVLFVTELHIDIPHQVIPQIIAHIHLLDLPIFILQLQKHVLEEIIIMLLRLDIPHYAHGSRQRGDSLLTRDGFVLRVLIHVLQKDGLRERRFVVKTRALVAMTTRTNFEVEGTIHLVLFCSKDGCKVFSHGD